MCGWRQRISGSTHTGRGGLEELLTRPNIGYLLKPYDEATLADALESVMGAGIRTPVILSPEVLTMWRILRWAVVVVCAAMGPLTMSAREGGLVIAGTVYQDRLVLAVRPHFLAAENVTLKLYRDDGDRIASAGDLLLATTKTDRAGMYVIPVASPGQYWVAVDSRTFHKGGWPEQTFGPAGSLCGHPEEGTRATMYEGSCFGGRTPGNSDDASALTTSEHVALVSVRDSMTNIDFAFSFDAVTNTLDGEGIQGSLRQYFVNANAVRGLNRMRFVPVERAPERGNKNYGVPPRWWSIALNTPLPALTDEDTLVDGTAHNFLSPGTILDFHPGRFEEPVTLKSGDPDLSRLKRPELELVVTGATGVVCAASCGLRSFAIHGAVTGLVIRADSRAEHVLVGVGADAAAVAGGEVGVQVERGTFTGRHVLVSSQARFGISVEPGAYLDGEYLDVSRSGGPLNGAGIALFSSGSSIRSSAISSNGGAGILLGSTDGKTPATGNTIDSSVISGNLGGVIIAPGSSRNAITRNDIMWNRVGGVTITPYENAPPRENRISANRFDENGLRPIILDLAADGNSLDLGDANCAGTANMPQRGISAPRMSRVEVSEEGGLRAMIKGRACPGQVVEIYQSFATATIREGSAQMSQVRDERGEAETISNRERVLRLPSIGEFNYVGATTAAADGTFSATFPLPSTKGTTPASSSIEDTKVWASQVLTSSSPEERGFSAIAIDPAGNTSEMSVRRKAD